MTREVQRGGRRDHSDRKADAHTKPKHYQGTQPRGGGKSAPRSPCHRNTNRVDPGVRWPSKRQESPNAPRHQCDGEQTPKHTRDGWVGPHKIVVRGGRGRAVCSGKLHKRVTTRDVCARQDHTGGCMRAQMRAWDRARARHGSADLHKRVTTRDVCARQDASEPQKAFRTLRFSWLQSRLLSVSRHAPPKRCRSVPHRKWDANVQARGGGTSRAH